MLRLLLVVPCMLFVMLAGNVFAEETIAKVEGKMPPPGFTYVHVKPDKCNLGPVLMPMQMSDAQYEEFAEEVAKRRLCDPDEKTTNYTATIANFHFPSRTCRNRPYVLPAGRLDTMKMEKMNRDFARRKTCEDRLMLEDREAVDDLILSLGGTAERTNDAFHWQVPFECHCKERIQEILGQLDRRDQDRINAYQADVARVQQKVRAQFGHN